MSSTKRTKQIKAKFFFVKDKVDLGEVKITDCRTELMWADVNSKPLQGTLFKVTRDKLMNCGVDYEDGYWADQPATKKQAAAIKPSSALKDGKLFPSYLAAAQECVGRPRSFKDLNHGSRVVNRARQVRGGGSGGSLMATHANRHATVTQ